MVFPHSFTSELVHALIDEWGLNNHDCILDPFVGAGTTLLAAKEKGVPGTGYDLLPLAVLAADVKVAEYNLNCLSYAWEALQGAIDLDQWQQPTQQYPDLVQQALPGKLLAAFEGISQRIAELECSETERNFFRLAMLALIPRFSRAVATGGWLKWVEPQLALDCLPEAFVGRVEMMMADLQELQFPMLIPGQAGWHARQENARQLPDDDGTYSAVITSPPYPNRHDYTRVFGVELMFHFLNWKETRQVRYQSIESHPEAHPVRPETEEYKQPAQLAKLMKELREKATDARIPTMLDGYFLDLYICFREIKRVCKAGARIAVIVGNAQYYGLPFTVDEFTAELGEQAGLTCDKIITVRYRGNSAQQMGQYGRKPSRESVVIFKR
jgi:site-specific DNA-methyltransferase (cytosine-N4-specific)